MNNSFIEFLWPVQTAEKSISHSGLDGFVDWGNIKMELWSKTNDEKAAFIQNVRGIEGIPNCFVQIEFLLDRVGQGESGFISRIIISIVRTVCAIRRVQIIDW